MYQGEAILPNHCWSAVSDPGNTTGMREVKKKAGVGGGVGRHGAGEKVWFLLEILPTTIACNFSPYLGNFASKDKRQCFFSS